MTIPPSLDPLRLYSARRLTTCVKAEFARVGAVPVDVRVRYTDAVSPPQDVLVERDGARMTVVIGTDKERDFARFIRTKICAFAYWMSLCDPAVTRMTVNVSDGHVVSAARFAASVRLPQHIGLPDPHFFQHNGFAADLARGQTAPQWQERSADIVWRGDVNGTGWFSLSPQDADNPAVMQRMRMVMRLRDTPDADVRFVRLPRVESGSTAWATQTGLLGAPIPAPSWLSRKFALDIDGFTNTWSNLLVRMLYGCCVLKVELQFGFRQWYYDGLKPFEHYVPVAADMSDLNEKIEWVRSHDNEARAIAAHGQAFARGLTFSTQARRAADLITAHWDRDDSSYASASS